MRLFILILMLSSFGQLQANNYYFSTASGNDSRSATEAQNEFTPWKTLGKLNSVFGTFNPGDSILLKRGEVFDGSIFITRSGSLAFPIVLSAYGIGAKPVINGFTALSNWASQSSGIWEATCSSDAMVNTVLIDGELKQIGRFPNSNTSNKGYLIPQSYTGNTQVTDNKLSSADWTGGDVVIRKARWVIDRSLITSQAGSTINYNSESGYQPPAKFGYFIQNHPKTLDLPGEWYYKLNEKKLGVYFPSSNPSSSTVQASTVSTLVTIAGQNNIVFDNLHFQGANISAFELTNASQVRISNCDIIFSSVNAVNATTSSNITVENSLIDHTNNVALNLNYCSNCTVSKNIIRNTGSTAGMGKGDSGSYEALMMTGDNILVQSNIIDSTGYIPVTFRGSNNNIKNNYLTNFTLVKDDGGGIYTWNNIPNAPATTGTKITDNIILNGRGAGEGTDDTTYRAANGIYMDDNTSNVEITGNTVASCGLNGIYIHNAHEIRIERNTVFDNRSQIVLARDGNAAYSAVRNIRMVNNIFFSKEFSQAVAEFKTPDNDIGSFGVFDSNYYCRPTEDNMVINAFYQFNGVYLNKAFTLDQWKAFSGQDNASKKTPVQLTSSAFIRFDFNPSASVKTISLGNNYIDARNNSYSGNVNLAPYSSLVLLQSGAPVDSIPSYGGCSATGSILREEWDNVGGNDVSNIPLDKAPTSSSQLTMLETTSIGDQYGDRIRGYICPPQTGNYVFGISADDAAELWLSSNDQPANKVKIASLLSYTDFRQFNKFASQISAPVTLVAGNRYYIEVLHKEGGGGDHLTVEWKLPNSVTEIPVSGSHLSPFTITNNGTTDQSINFGSLASRTFGDAPFTIAASASSGLPVSFRIVSGSATVSGNMVTLNGAGTVVVEASQQGNDTYRAAPAVTQSFTVLPATLQGGCSATGTILREEWDNVGGNDVSNIPLDKAPTSSGQLTMLETNSMGDQYGDRIRGYICPPQTGSYLFGVSADDAAELWLSTDDQPVNKMKIASVLSYTDFRDFNKFPSQISAPVTLVAGTRYYIEVLHKEGGGGDHLTVGWKLPNTVIEIPIAGSRLSPFVLSGASGYASDVNTYAMAMKEQTIIREPVLKVFPSPFKNQATIMFYPVEAGKVKLDLYDVLGRPLRSLFAGKVEAGATKKVMLNGAGMAGGVYFIHLVSGTKVLTQKITLLK